MTLNINVTKEIKLNLSNDDIIDILAACFEGGCNYWACIDNTTDEWKTAALQAKEKDPDYTIEDIMIQLWENGDAIELQDEEDEDEIYELTKEKFISGIKQAIENEYWNGDDIADIDGEVGDVIIQYGLFDDVIFG